MNNKKTLVGALLVAIIGLIGLTIAFFIGNITEMILLIFHLSRIRRGFPIRL